MSDPYSTLRAAFHAGATIQAFRVAGDDGQTPIDQCGVGTWDDLSCDGEPKFSCHFSRYRIKVEE